MEGEERGSKGTFWICPRNTANWSRNKKADLMAVVFVFQEKN